MWTDWAEGRKRSPLPRRQKTGQQTRQGLPQEGTGWFSPKRAAGSLVTRSWAFPLPRYRPWRHANPGCHRSGHYPWHGVTQTLLTGILVTLVATCKTSAMCKEQCTCAVCLVSEVRQYLRKGPKLWLPEGKARDLQSERAAYALQARLPGPPPPASGLLRAPPLPEVLKVRPAPSSP